MYIYMYIYIYIYIQGKHESKKTFLLKTFRCKSSTVSLLQLLTLEQPARNITELRKYFIVHDGRKIFALFITRLNANHTKYNNS